MTKIQNKGFTLIELLVVLAIIGILIALAIVGLRGAQASQRDTARKDIINQINAQIQSWYSTNGSYPTTSNFVAASGGFINQSGCSGNNFSLNGSCEGQDGLNFTVPTSLTGTDVFNCTSSMPTLAPSDLQLCYTPSDTGSGTSGYTLGVILEQTKGIYYIAQ